MIPGALPSVTRDEWSAPFFDGTAAGKLVMPRCPDGHFMALTQGYGGHAIYCHVCGSPDLEWQPVSGAATLVSWVVPHARSGEPTAVAGIVQLAEGVWLNALLDVPPDADLEPGQPLMVGFVPTNGGEAIPVFRPNTQESR
jgi:uncharacterized protein